MTVTFILLAVATVLLATGINTALQLRDAKRRIRGLFVELKTLRQELRIEKEYSWCGTIAPVAEGDDAAYTEEERRVMDHLVVCWNLYVGLPRDHPDDVDDFKDGIHTLQRIILANVALRDGRRRPA